MTQAGVGTKSRRYSILVIDADALSRNVTEQVLRHNGYRPLLARDVGEALLLCAIVDGRVDLAVVDVMNTGMPGPRVMAMLRRRYTGIRCVYLAAPSSAPNLEALPLAPVLPKPFGVRTFLETLRTTLDGE